MNRIGSDHGHRLRWSPAVTVIDPFAARTLAATASDARPSRRRRYSRPPWSAVRVGGRRRDEDLGHRHGPRMSDPADLRGRPSAGFLLRAAAPATGIARRRGDDAGPAQPGFAGWWTRLDGTTNFPLRHPPVSAVFDRGRDRRPARGGHGHRPVAATRCGPRAGPATASYLKRAPVFSCRNGPPPPSIGPCCATGFGYPEPRREGGWQAAVAAAGDSRGGGTIRRFGSAALDLCWTGGRSLRRVLRVGLEPVGLQCRLAGGFGRRGARVGESGEGGWVVAGGGDRCSIRCCRLCSRDAGGFRSSPPVPKPTEVVGRRRGA